MHSMLHTLAAARRRRTSSRRANRRSPWWAVAPALALVAASCAPAPPPSLPQFKASLVRYVDSRRYDADVQLVTDRAERFLRRAAPAAPRPALVLDIDETSLSNWPYQLASDFCYDSADFHAWVLRREAEAIAGVLELYSTARELGVAVFFVTGRHEDQRAATEANLRAVGFAGWAGLDMRPRGDGHPSAAVFKTEVRRRISDEGYVILANVGDQESDLAGGFARRAFKLPNPFYEVP